MSFKTCLSRRATLVGTLITTTSPDIVEAVSYGEIDWLFLDREHGSIPIEQLGNLVRAAGDRCFTVVRVASDSEDEIKRALDSGVDGIIVPQVNNRKQAEEVVQRSKYPPAGRRSVGIGRAQGYGANLQKYVDTSNETVAVIVQIEHIEAVTNVFDIIDVDGVDGIFIGPYDLSGSMNKIGQIDSPEVQDAIHKVYEAARKTNCPLGAFVPTIEHGKAAIHNGVSFLAVGSETTHLLARINEMNVSLVKGGSNESY